MKIGIALGAGAARGWAHIGIIKALQEAGVNIDIVAGSSIGAYVGAAFASNRLDELEQWSNSLTEWQVFRLLGLGFNRGGLADGEKVFEKLQTEFCASNFEEMSLPFSVVATDLYSGREVVFNKGEIGHSIRASCAIPALLSPVNHDGRWLVDGAIVNPVPVNQCRQLGADFVIAVNLSADFKPQRVSKFDKQHQESVQNSEQVIEKHTPNFVKQWFLGDKNDKESQAPSPPSIINIMSNSLEILQARVTRSRLAGDPPDILIEPQLRDVGLLEFHRAQELNNKGRESVQRLSEQIRYQLDI